MKTRLLAACTFVSGLFMASCGDMDQHQLMIAYPAQGYSILFADQTVDSISFLTFDSWKIIIHNNEWIRVTGDESGTIKHDNDKRYWVTTELEFAPNTNRHSRIGAVEVQSYDYQVGARYLQFGHLDITRPSAKVETKLPNSTIPDSVSFCLADNAAQDATGNFFRRFFGNLFSNLFGFSFFRFRFRLRFFICIERRNFFLFRDESGFIVIFCSACNHANEHCDDHQKCQ